MSDVQFIWFFILCAVLWVLFSTACWYKIICDDHKREKYFTVTGVDLAGLIICIIVGPLVWFAIIIGIIASHLTIKNHFYRGY